VAEEQQPFHYDHKAFLKQLGARVRSLRKESGLTLRALQIDYDFHLTQIVRIEKGEGISVAMLLRIAETFQVPVEHLIAGIGFAGETGDIVQSPPPTGGTKKSRKKG
jgi:transcriptional regulator with XRE-family HTH domain